MSIKKSLQSSMVVVASIPVFIFAIFTILIVFQNYLNISRENAKNIAFNYQQGFTALLNTQKVESESISKNSELATVMLKKYNNPDINLRNDTMSQISIHRMLEQASNNFGNHVVYSVYDMEGYLTYSSDNSLSVITATILKI